MSFDRIYATYIDMVYSYLKFKLKEEHIVEDLVQETFLAVYKQREKLPNKDSVKAWILAIAHNKMVDVLRKPKIKEVMLNDNHNVDYTQPDNLFLEQCIKQLDEECQLIIYGLYVEQLTCRQLAEILGCPEGTVKSKAYTARKQLRGWLKEESQC